MRASNYKGATGAIIVTERLDGRLDVSDSPIPDYPGASVQVLKLITNRRIYDKGRLSFDADSYRSIIVIKANYYFLCVLRSYRHRVF